MHFSEEEIIKLYNTKVKKNAEYFKKGLIKCPVKSYNYSWKNKDAPRCFCVRDFIEWVDKYHIKNCKHLGYTYELDPEIEFINADKKTLYLYNAKGKPENKIKNDLHTFVCKEKHDFFIFNQTLEHLYNPYMALQQISESMLPGGYVFTSVPTINIPHCTPFNFSNWYPMGLAILFASAGFEIVETGQWGNYNYINRVFKTGWPDVYQTGEQNEENNVVQCWILAKKK